MTTLVEFGGTTFVFPRARRPARSRAALAPAVRLRSLRLPTWVSKRERNFDRMATVIRQKGIETMKRPKTLAIIASVGMMALAHCAAGEKLPDAVNDFDRALRVIFFPEICASASRPSGGFLPLSLLRAAFFLGSAHC